MDFQFYEVSDLPVVCIDNYYDNAAVENIMQELKFLNSPYVLKGPESTGSAINVNGKFTKNNSGLFLDKYFSETGAESSILIENRKLWSEDIFEVLRNNHKFWDYLFTSTRNYTLLSYYDDDAHYGEHSDEAVITVCSWFFKEPKAFKGGDFIIKDGPVFECKFNRTVIFPSILKHSVTPVTLQEENKNKKLGRYTITQSLHI